MASLLITPSILFAGPPNVPLLIVVVDVSLLFKLNLVLYVPLSIVNEEDPLLLIVKSVDVNVVIDKLASVLFNVPV